MSIFLTTPSRVMMVGPSTNSVVFYRHSTCFTTRAVGFALKVKFVQ